MHTAAKLARIAMWVMIGAIVLSFFIQERWVRMVWVAAAIVCFVCVLIVAVSKKRR